jgi:hypothetical protein
MILLNWSGGKVFEVADQQVFHPVLDIAGTAAATVFLPDDPSAHVADHLGGQLHNMERVHRDGGRGQHAASRTGVGAAHVDDHDPHPLPPCWSGLVQPVGGVLGAAALDLPQQALITVDVDEAGVPAISGQHVAPGGGVMPELRSAPAGLIDAQHAHRCHLLAQHRIGPAGERLVRGWPGHRALGSRIRDCHPQLADQMRGVLPHPLDQPGRGGISGADSVNVARPQPPLSQRHRRFSHITSTWALPRIPADHDRSRGRVVTCSCTRRAATEHSGQRGADSRSVASHTVNPPSGSTSTSTTLTPCIPNRAEAMS